MSAFDKLVELFRTFPGIGPRQAKRFAYHLVLSRASFNKELAHAVEIVKKEVRECAICHRFYSGTTAECSICRDAKRDQSILMVIAHDTDLESIEKSKTYEGRYFVLGTLMSLTEKEALPREAELVGIVSKQKAILSEIIVAMSVTAEGDYTADHIKKVLAPAIADTKIKVTTLGRGVSTGSELEYADSETIKSALLGRK